MIKNLKKCSISHVTHIKLLLTMVTCIASSALSATSEVSISKNLFLQRAFSANTTRELLMEGHVTPTDFDGFYSFFSFTGAYQHSWEQNEQYGIGAFPFWSGTNSMTVGTNNGANAVDAYQFGLGQVTTAGSITLNPIVYQGGTDLLLYLGSSINDPGAFIKIKVPLGVIVINPQLTEGQITAAANYPAGELSLSTSAVNDPATTMTQAFAGYLSGGQEANGDFLPMQYGLINGKQSSGAQFGDFEMTLGYNILCNEDHVLGLAFRASGPSANTPTGEFLLQPIFGRGGYWGVGGYIFGKSKLWENHTNSSLTVNVMATVLHLLNTSTVRSYDLTLNGPGSKYLLVADFGNNTYGGVIQNLINVSTLDSSSSFSAEGDVSISLSYLSNGWSLDFGYNFWGRTAEELTITGSFPANQYAVLGRQSAGQVGLSPTTPGNLAQPNALINFSDNQTNTISGNVVSATIPSNRISGITAFNVAAAEQASASTSKIFAKLGYSWLDSHFSPHVGVAGEFEISTCDNNALPQWAVAFIGGFFF